MRIRELRGDDLEGLKKLVLGVYDDSPDAMLFLARPDAAELEALFLKKLEGARAGGMVDVVAEDESGIVGECEIVMDVDGKGRIGLIVEKQQKERDRHEASLPGPEDGKRYRSGRVCS